MPVAATQYSHVVLDDAGHPCLAGTRMHVAQLVAEREAYGWSPEELHFQHPDLSLGQIHSALAYYWDHVDAIEAEIQAELAEIDALGCQRGVSPLISRLRSQGLL